MRRPLSPTWLLESWSDVLARADRLTPAEKATAQAKLAEIFTAEWTAACTMHHPVVHTQLTYAGRLVLLELGHAAAVLGIDDRMIQRLRDPREYFGAAAELYAALLFRRSGAILYREPQGEGSALAEFGLGWPSGVEAIVEVKALRQADEVRAAEEVIGETIHQFAMLAREVPGFAGRLEWSDAIMHEPPDGAAVFVAVHFALARAKARDTRTVHQVPITGIGTLHLVPVASSRALHITYGGYAPSDAAIYQRLRRRAADAMSQLATHPHLPGILVLDVDACGMARNGLDRLALWARKQPQLAVVIVIEREHSSTASYTNVRFLQGPRVREVAELHQAFEVCSEGHLHYQPLCTPANPCPCAFWLSRVE